MTGSVDVVSAVSLASKCSTSAFRMHIRADDTFMKMLSSLHDAPEDPVCHSCVWCIHCLCNVACGSGIVTVNSSSGSTLQCDTWLWDDMPLNSPERPPYWNSTSGFDFDISLQSTCHSAPVSKILSKSDHPRQKKWRHVDFQDGGSQSSWIVVMQ